MQPTLSLTSSHGILAPSPRGMVQAQPYEQRIWRSQLRAAEDFPSSPVDRDARKEPCVTILPRQRKGSPPPCSDSARRPVFLRSKDILALFHLQQRSAADKL
eukprot:764105-Hanusia_phi.AAC.1